jgi:hypothetical protein
MEGAGDHVTTYKVTARTGFRGYAEGEEFEADLSEAEERRAKERGSIRVVKRDDAEKEGKAK